MTTTQEMDCFGQAWDPDAKECAGGYDPTYRSQSGSYVRPRCDLFDSCRSRVMLTRANQQQQRLVPPSALLKPQQQAQQPFVPQPIVRPSQVPQPAHPMMPSMVPMPAMTPQQQQQMMQQMQQWQMMQMGGMGQMYPQMAPYPMQMAPLQMMPVQYQMPSYLSVPEVRTTFWKTLGLELVRGMGKALGHSIAHFFDNNSFTRS